MRSIYKAALLATMTVGLAIACAPRAAAPSQTATSTTSAPTVAAATTTPATPPSTSTAQPTGTITGLVGYPADGRPAMTLYAISTTDRGVYASVDVPAGTDPKPTYTITRVRPGTYNVFAYLAGNDRAAGAYTEFVNCGNRVGCSDHTPIAVTVGAGETVRDIEVSDFYAFPDAPPRPR